MKDKNFKEEVVMGRDEFKEFLQLPYERQLNDYFNKNDRPSERIIRYRCSEKYLTLECIDGFVTFSGHSFNPIHKTTMKFIYNKDKNKITSTYDKADLIYHLASLPSFEWVKREFDNRYINPQILSNRIVADILSGELEDAESTVKRYLHNIGMMEVDWELYNKYLYSSYDMPISWIKAATTDVNEALKLLIADKTGEIRNIIKMSLSLGTTFDPTWSDSQREEEYRNLIRIVKRENLESKGVEPIFSECPSFNYPCKILNTERDVYFEAWEMCCLIYEYSWDNIENRKYLVCSFTAPQRMTLILHREGTDFKFYKCVAKGDQEISPEADKMIQKFLSDKEVQAEIEKLANNYPIESSESQLNTDTDLPF